jgi:hypothetical protein
MSVFLPTGMSVFLLPTLYVWIAGDHDILPQSPTLSPWGPRLVPSNSADAIFSEGEHVD